LKKILIYIAVVVAFSSCQPENMTGNVIVFADVIGEYEGECADFESSMTDLMNREEATLSVFARDIETAGINTSCDRFDNYDIKLKNANAAKIEFQNDLGNNEIISLVYYSKQDSLILTYIHSEGSNQLFAGVRK